ncbi:hypothetical protein D9757_010716 [Collybiopsis confluens]|uniref:Uncharacterized protein n=1 Tax=Collybiopsis confluens TaxID=2823264 RepID=A0A8H5GZY6_9AGAR|nr:hypothetical protein D9757_010716 [Collybiopsis confluens]
MKITATQKAAFDRDGFLILPSVSEAVSQNIEKWANEVKNLPSSPDAWMHYDEINSAGKQILSRTENFASYHEGFNALFRGQEMLGILEALMGEPVALLKEKINYKQAWAGGYSAHIDSVAYEHIAPVKHLSVLMAAEPSTLENGCLEVVAGSHKAPIPMGKDRCIPSEWCEKHEWIPVPLESGQFLIFSSYLAHRSGSNNSEKGRAAIYATYNVLSDGGDKHEAYYEDRRKAWPPTSERITGERYEEGAKIYGFGSPMLTVEKNGYKDIGL